MQQVTAPTWENMKMKLWNSSRRWQRIATTMQLNHSEEVRCRRDRWSTQNQRRRGCSSKESTKWQKSRIYYWIDSTSATASEGLTPVSHEEASPCANCSRFNHVELECTVMAIQGQDMFIQGPSRGLTQQGWSNFPGAYLNYYNTPVFNNIS